MERHEDREPVGVGLLRTTDPIDDRLVDGIREIRGLRWIGDVQVGSNQGKQISYQYTDSEGTPLQGIAIVTYVADTRQGYLLQMEATQEQSSAAQPVIDQVLKSIQFFTPVQ